MMRAAILCYHSQNIQDNTYELNNHLALEDDLITLHELGLPVIGLGTLVRALRGKKSGGKSAESIGALPKRAVVLTCDDGCVLDWEDYDHPQFGFQKSFARILREHFGEAMPAEAMTSFVIAGPQPREQIDAGCYNGEPLSSDRWWAAAAASGYWAIGNHGWDHRHPCLQETPDEDYPLGEFYRVDDYARADYQIHQASEYINRQLAPAGRRTAFFAYPYGHVNDYLAKEYLPGFVAKHGMRAAVTTAPELVDEQSPLYALPRLVCGDAWRTRAEFRDWMQRLLAA